MHEGKIIIFTDGSSRGNPGPGGWGAIVIYSVNDDRESKVESRKLKVTELGGREDHTTNNRMEIAAALAALSFVEKRKIEGPIEVHTDSAYLLQGITGWVYGWEKNGWKTKTGDDVLNQDLWKQLGALVFRLKQKHVLDWKKVGGHIGLLGNERADEIATNAADKSQQILFVGSLADYEQLIGGSVLGGQDGEKVLKKKKASGKSGPAYSYVSQVGGLIAVHKTWPECEERVKGKSGVKYQKVFSVDEEKALINDWTTHMLKR